MSVSAEKPLPIFHGMVGDSPAMQKLQMQLRRIGPYFRTVLVTGETGTGKELVARALHDLSPAASGPFVVCNASAIVETLFETELFRHTKGAFTGALTDRQGLFEAAHKGTLFLDEIGEMPLGAQAKLLRALQNREVLRVGSSQVRKVEARVVAATNRDLRRLAAAGQFREDLYYRISMVELVLPPLRERVEDIGVLAAYFAAQFSELYGKPLMTFSEVAIERLCEHSWPGNIRELENVIGNTVMQVEAQQIEVNHLPSLCSGPRVEGSSGSAMSLHALVESHVRKVLGQCDGNKVRAAEMLGISRSTLYRMLGTAG